MPLLFKLWQASNSSILDDRMLELVGEVSAEHIAGKFGVSGEEGADWKDVGIWSQDEWTFLISKGLSSMSEPFSFSFL